MVGERRKTGLLLLGHLVFEGWRIEKRKMAAPVGPAACWSLGITWAQLERFSNLRLCKYPNSQEGCTYDGAEGGTE